MAESRCDLCGEQYLVDLPVGHALWDGVIYNRRRNEVANFRAGLPNNPSWYVTAFRKSLEETPWMSPKIRRHKRSDACRMTVVNCLDSVYGHALLKLLNVQRHLERDSGGTCCVLVPTPLVHLVPDAVAEIWEVEVGFPDAGRWFPNVNEWVHDRIAERKECFLSRAYSHPNPKVYDIARFVKQLPAAPLTYQEGQPTTVFVWREDDGRLWGGDLAAQVDNLRRLRTMLREMFAGLKFVVAGVARERGLAVSDFADYDLRSLLVNLTEEREREVLACIGTADVAIGAHGSHMLLPSALAKNTIELVPRHKLLNCFQSTLISPSPEDPREALLKYRYVYGDSTLRDVNPETVADLVASVVVNNDRSVYFFAMDGQGERRFRGFPEEYPRVFRHLNRRRR